MDVWWADHAPEMFGLVMSSSLAAYSIILIVSPLPRTIYRWSIVASGLAASFVGLYHSAVEHVPPFAVGTMAVWMVLLTIGSIRYRSRLIAARFDKGRRADDD